MADIIKTIGTASRDYSTITLWNAANGGGTSSDNITGQMYDDSAFNEMFDIAFAALSTTLTVPSGERHDGTSGTGVRDVPTVGGNEAVADVGYSTVRNPTVLEWMEIDANGRDLRCLEQGDCGEGWFRNLICCRSADYDHGYSVISGPHGNPMHFLNCLIYDSKATFNAGTIHARGFFVTGPQNGTLNICNVTIHDVHKDSALGEARCIDTVDDSDVQLRNVICTSPGGSSSGTKRCYYLTAPSNASHQYILSSDSSASGTGSLINKSAADLFVSSVRGSEDLHLKASADAIDAGTDLGTTPTGVNIDINGRDRDAEDDTWDIGAHEFVATGGGGKVPYSYLLANRYGIVLR